MTHSWLSSARRVSRVALLLFLCARGAYGQNADSMGNIAPRPGMFTRVVLLDGPARDSIRTWSLRKATESLSLLASPSSLTPPITSTSKLAGRLILPEIRAAYNSALPYSLNDGALWAGRGWNFDVVLGLEARWRMARLLVLPELTRSANAPFDTTAPSIFGPRRPSRSPWSSPFHPRSESIDLPIRFGDQSLSDIGWGQSALVLRNDAVEYGVASENNWWGPGIRSALLLSNNAAGFPHLFVRTARPVPTRIGAVEARWIAGGLSESDFFDQAPGNDRRSIVIFGATLQPRHVDGLTVGAARAVFAPTDRWSSALTSFGNVFRDVGNPNAVPYADTSIAPGPDQLLSLFARWVFPGDGLEAYAEWARADFPKSLRDFLVQPQHTQAYVFGVQWLGEESTRTRGRLRAQAEATYLQQSTTYRFRPLGSWYTSRAVPQGYTNRGQTIGAGIGPGSSSQWLALDHLATSWGVGVYVNRIRWLEDARSQTFVGLPIGNGWCEHDVSMLGGVRGELGTRVGRVSVDYGTGWRRNVFFNHVLNSCPFNGFGTDVRVRQLKVSLSPVVRR